MIAALVVFLPGAALTTAVTELAGGEMIAGSSRLVWAAVQPTSLAFGILAGIEAVGISTSEVFSGSASHLADWAPWLGVLVYAIGVSVAHSAPKGSFIGLLVVLYAAWLGQFLGDRLFGGFVSGLVGALWVEDGPLYTGRYTDHASGAVIGAEGFTFTSTFSGTGSASDGSPFHFHAVGHITITPDGELVREFQMQGGSC